EGDPPPDRQLAVLGAPAPSPRGEVPAPFDWLHLDSVSERFACDSRLRERGRADNAASWRVVVRRPGVAGVGLTRTAFVLCRPQGYKRRTRPSARPSANMPAWRSDAKTS